MTKRTKEQWAEEARKLEAKGVNNRRDMIEGLSKVHPTIVATPEGLYKSALAGGFKWIKKEDLRSNNPAMKSKTAEKEKRIASTALELMEKRPDLADLGNNTFFKSVKIKLLKIEKVEGIQLVGKSGNVDSIIAQAKRGGFTLKNIKSRKKR